MIWTTSTQLALTATEAVVAMQSGTLRSADYMATLLAQATNLSGLNTLTMLDMDAALAAAQRLDALPSEARARLPLAGLPIVVKDNINTRGLVTSAGTPTLAHFVPRDNAPSLQRLLDAGAIILGKANMHELAFGVTSTNLAPHAGPVRNPYDPSLIPGGSSGGTAAAIAARIVPAGLGTDTGGSVRIPAALTGIAGLRPSVGNGGAQRRYHNPHAVVPISPTRDTIGPMGRTVADLALLDAVMVGAHPLPALVLPGLRIGLPAPLWEGLEHVVGQVMATVRERLAAAGVVLIPIEMPELLPLNEQVSFVLALHEPLEAQPAWLATNHAPVRTVADIAAGIASPDVRKFYSMIMEAPFAHQYPDVMSLWRPRLQQLYASTFASNRLDALLFPTTRLVAVPIDEVFGSSTVSIDGSTAIDTMQAFLRNVDPGSNAGIPGLSLPAGLTPKGLPVGLGLDGPLGSDRRLLSIGIAVELLLGTINAPRTVNNL